jgi:hypothetical protein
LLFQLWDWSSSLASMLVDFQFDGTWDRTWDRNWDSIKLGCFLKLWIYFWPIEVFVLKFWTVKGFTSSNQKFFLFQSWFFELQKFLASFSVEIRSQISFFFINLLENYGNNCLLWKNDTFALAWNIPYAD